MKRHRRLHRARHARSRAPGRTAPSNPARAKTPLFAILLVAFCTILTSSGQLLLKLGTQKLELTPLGILGNVPLIIGCVLYGVGAIIMIIALKYGELSVLAPIIGLSFIWVMLLSIFVLHEHVSVLNWLGVGLILAGVTFVGKGGS